MMNSIDRDPAVRSEGGGCRIAIYAGNTNTFLGVVSATNGIGYANGTTGTVYCAYWRLPVRGSLILIR